MSIRRGLSLLRVDFDHDISKKLDTSPQSGQLRHPVYPSFQIRYFIFGNIVRSRSFEHMQDIGVHYIKSRTLLSLELV